MYRVIAGSGGAECGPIVLSFLLAVQLKKTKATDHLKCAFFILNSQPSFNRMYHSKVRDMMTECLIQREKKCRVENFLRKNHSQRREK